MTRDNTLSAIGACVRKLRRAPSPQEFTRLTGIKHARLLLHFPNMRSAVRAAGTEIRPRDFPISENALLTDWAEVVRKLKRPPTWGEYIEEGTYHPPALKKHFGGLPRVAKRFLRLARKTRGWQDVVEFIRNPIPNQQQFGPPGPLPKHRRQPAVEDYLIESHKMPNRTRASTSFLRTTVSSLARSSLARTGVRPATLPPRSDRPILGAPLPLSCLTHAPVNEQGTVFLFGMLARRLGFRVECVQKGFPDCEAKRELRPGLWQHVRIEFEFESKNFHYHGHDATKCDIIVCWKYNWLEIPEHLDVVELRQVVRHMMGSRPAMAADLSRRAVERR